MKEYILKGESKELEKIIRENRIRVERGVIQIAPVQPETESTEALKEALTASKRALTASEESCSELSTSHTELLNVTEEIIALAVENNCVIPDSIEEKLHKFGIIVPKIEEMKETIPESGENVAENVPNDADQTDMEAANPAEMDNKDIGLEDLKEVDLDADDKSAESTDSKEVQQTDTKASTPAKKRRTKKSE